MLASFSHAFRARDIFFRMPADAAAFDALLLAMTPPCRRFSPCRHAAYATLIFLSPFHADTPYVYSMPFIDFSPLMPAFSIFAFA